MSRVLFVVPPLTGHVNPAVGVASELVARGHQVALSGHASVIGPLIPPDLPLLAMPESASNAEQLALLERSKGLRGAASLKFLWEEFLLPLAEVSIPVVDAIVDEFRPDVLVIDQQAVGAAVVARRRGLRWVTLATTSAELDNPYDVLAGLGQWVADLLRRFQLDHGVPPALASHGDLRFSDELVIVFSVRELLRDGSQVTPSAVFIGSAAGGRRVASAQFPWWWLDPKRRAVLVSLGTVTREAGGSFLRAAAEGLLELRDQTQTIVVAPPALLDGLGGSEDLLISPFVPQVDLMPRLSAVVCHGGNNTVCEALLHGVPLVVAPVRDDQPIIGEQVVRSGAGLRIRFGRTGPAGVRAAVSTVLDQPEYAAAAGRLQESFQRAGGVSAAAEHIEKLLV